MFRYSCILLLLCALTQTQTLRILARAAPSASEEAVDEDPEPEGRVFSGIKIITDSDREPSRYPHYDPKPIIITTPPQHSHPAPAYPPHYPHYPQYPQHIPYPVHVHPQPPQTIPIIVNPKPHYHRPQHIHHYNHHGHNHGHHHGHHNHGYNHGFPPFINITYSPVLAAATTTGGTEVGGGGGGGLLGRIGDRNTNQEQLNGLAQLSQLLLAQSLPQAMNNNPAILTARPQLQQLPQQYQVQSSALPSNLIYQPAYNNRDGDYELTDVQQDQQYYIDLDDVEQEDEIETPKRKMKPKRTQYVVRRSQKPKKKSKKTKKQPEMLYLAVDNTEAEAEAQADIMEAQI